MKRSLKFDGTQSEIFSARRRNNTGNLTLHVIELVLETTTFLEPMALASGAIGPTAAKSKPLANAIGSDFIRPESTLRLATVGDSRKESTDRQHHIDASNSKIRAAVSMRSILRQDAKRSAMSPT